jgi:nitric oxide reductase large subunit
MGSASREMVISLLWFQVAIVTFLFGFAVLGYWYAREPEFFQQPLVRLFEWLRMPGDLLFIIGGILPVVYLALRMAAQRRRYASLPPETSTEQFTTTA